MIPKELEQLVVHRRITPLKISVGELVDLCEEHEDHPIAQRFLAAVEELDENQEVTVDAVDVEAVESGARVRYRTEMRDGVPYRVKVLKAPKAAPADAGKSKGDDEQNTSRPLQAGQRGVGDSPRPASVLPPGGKPATETDDGKEEEGDAAG